MIPKGNFSKFSTQCSAVQYNSVQQSTGRCSAVQRSAVQCREVQCTADFRRSAVQCSAIQCSKAWGGAVQCSAMQSSVGGVQCTADASLSSSAQEENRCSEEDVEKGSKKI